MPIYLVLPKRRKIIDVISEKAIDYDPSIESHQNFDPYCFIVENYISRSEYRQIQTLKEILIGSASKKAKFNTTRLYIETTNSCNLDCSICYLEKGNEKLSTEYILKLIEDELNQYSLQDICISGGECTLHEGLGEIVKKATESTRCLVLTNGLILPKSLLELKTFNPVTLILNTNKKTILDPRFGTNIRLYQRHKYFRLVFCVVVSKDAPTLEELKNFLEENRVSRYSIYITDVRGYRNDVSDTNYERSIVEEYTKALCSGGYPLTCMTPYIHRRLFRCFQLPCITTKFYSYRGHEIRCVFRYKESRIYLPAECRICEWFFVCSRVCSLPNTTEGQKDELRCMISRYNGIRNLILSSKSYN